MPEAVGGFLACPYLVFLTLLVDKVSFLKHILKSWLKEEMVGQFHNPLAFIPKKAWYLIGIVKFSYIKASLFGTIGLSGVWKERVTCF